MQTSARADRETRAVSASKTSTPSTINAENAGAAAGRIPVTSRRNFLMNAVVSTAALANAATVSAPSIAAGIDSDPIFRCIDEHRAAFVEWMDVIGDTPTDDDDLRSSGPDVDLAEARKEEAAGALVNVRPTTIAGVLALATYVHEFDTGNLRSKRPRLCSEHPLWPDNLSDENDFTLPFAHWIVENIGAALADIQQTMGDAKAA